MGLDDLLIKKKAKVYIRNRLLKWLKVAQPNDLITPTTIANYLANQLEKFFEENFL